ncbi:hypothetical protein QR680_006130 [Steinernema hermaphroditum]|uniref:WDR5-like beta-propeller domain-containing protein n=1 Tax=Steinernema hermaphroditum TaxID=289476 RepID=A0AA39HWQ8_9BILA|nr:hypothetical protein QR680_006130 [Steinernema hermaphroditum]
MDICSKEFSSLEDDTLLARETMFVSRQRVVPESAIEPQSTSTPEPALLVPEPTDSVPEPPAVSAPVPPETPVPVIEDETQELARKTESTKPRRREAPNYTLIAELSGCTAPVTSVKFSPDGFYVASGCVDKTFRVWKTGEDFAEVSKCRAHSTGINDIAWSADSRFLASCSDDGVVKVYDMQWTKRKIAMECHSNYVISVDFNPQGNLLLTGSFDNTAKIWDLRSGTCVATLDEHTQPVSSASFNYDGSLICTTSYDGATNLWDTRTNRCLRILEMENDDAVAVPCGYAKFSPNGRYILVAKHNSRMHMVDSKKERVVRTYSGHQNSQYCLVADFSITGKKWIVSGSEDGCLYIWDMQTCEIVQVIRGNGDVVIAVDCSLKSNMIASATIGSNDRCVRLWHSKDQ